MNKEVMKERIKKLYEQAHIEHRQEYFSSIVDPTIKSVSVTRHFDLNLFTELLLGDVIGTIYKSDIGYKKQEQGEPVAWRAPNWGHDNDTRPWSYRDHDEPFYPPEGGEPLYTKPQPKQEQGEPVAWFREEDEEKIYYATKAWDDCLPLYTTPQTKEWVGLTQTQVKLLYEGVREEAIKSGDSLNWVFYTHINEALKEKNK